MFVEAMGSLLEEVGQHRTSLECGVRMILAPSGESIQAKANDQKRQSGNHKAILSKGLGCFAVANIASNVNPGFHRVIATNSGFLSPLIAVNLEIDASLSRSVIRLCNKRVDTRSI
jgi:hypothetical protein